MKGCHEKDAEQLFLFSGINEEREIVQERRRLDLKKEKDASCERESGMPSIVRNAVPHRQLWVLDCLPLFLGGRLHDFTEHLLT